MKIKNSIFCTLIVLLTIKITGCSFDSGEGIIEDVFPSHGSSAVDTETSITVRTNLPVDSFSLEKNNGLVVKTASGEVIQGETITDSTRTLITFVPENAFPNDENFFICLQSSFRTASGISFNSYRVDPDLEFLDPFQSGDCFHFSTNPALKIRRAFSSSHHGEIRVYFSREPDLESIRKAEITWKQNQMTGSVSMRYNPTKNMLIIYPRGNADLSRTLSLVFPESFSTHDGIRLENPIIEVSPMD